MSEAELERSLRICAACMYCDALCPVFPQLVGKHEYSPADLHYLAHLCHNCRTCWDVCPYAPPHPFALNLPAAFAAQRRRSYAEHVWPRLLAPAFRRPALALAVFAVAAVAAMLALVAARPSATADAGSLYAVASRLALTGVAGGVLIGALVSLTASALRFWRTIVAAAPKRRWLRALLPALSDVLSLRHLDGELDCSRRRRPLHHLMAAGLGLDLVATLAAAALQHLDGIEPPYPLVSLPVLAGAAGGFAALTGAAGLLAFEAMSDRGPRELGEAMLNVVLLCAIALAAASGLALLALRETAALRPLLALHFGAVCGLFAMLPASKILHAPFRAAALWRAAADRVNSRDG